MPTAHPPTAGAPPPYRIDGTLLERFVADLFESAGVPAQDAATVAALLVEADRSGVPTHGCMLVPLYLERIIAGSVNAEADIQVVSDSGTMVVLDARNALGQLSSIYSIDLAIARAGVHGIGLVATRHAFHFGRGAPYARRAAEAGLIGVALSNTRPLMPAPGGSNPAIGNNPVSVAIPRAGHPPVVVDLALSETSMGALRVAAASGLDIPPTWATDSAGNVTTDPEVALGGMLLPSGGHKGFSLALVVEVMTSVLAGGAVGPRVQGLYGDRSVPYDCSHFFAAVSPAASGDPSGFAERMEELCGWITGPGDRLPGDRLPGDRLPGTRLPGDRSRMAAEEADRSGVPLYPSVVEDLRRIGGQMSVDTSLLADE